MFRPWTSWDPCGLIRCHNIPGWVDQEHCQQEGQAQGEAQQLPRWWQVQRLVLWFSRSISSHYNPKPVLWFSRSISSHCVISCVLYNNYIFGPKWNFRNCLKYNFHQFTEHSIFKINILENLFYISTPNTLKEKYF